MDIEKILKQLFVEVPEMETLYNLTSDVCNPQMDGGAYAVWEIGVMHNVDFLLQEYLEYREIVKDVFAFFEKLATHENADVRVFFQETTMHHFYENKPVLKTALQFMGDETKKLWYEFHEYIRCVYLLYLAGLYTDTEMDQMGIPYRYPT